MYLVIELQTVNEAQVANIVTAFTDRNSAEAKYHTVLAAASVSTLPCHSAVILDETGRTVKGPEFYKHEVINND